MLIRPLLLLKDHLMISTFCLDPIRMRTALVVGNVGAEADMETSTGLLDYAEPFWVGLLKGSQVKPCSSSDSGLGCRPITRRIDERTGGYCI